MRIRLTRLLAATAATLVATGLAVLGTATAANAAPIGTLTVSPPSGADDTPMSVSTSGPCPTTATTIQVTIQGAGFPTTGFNVVGASPISSFPTNPSGGLNIPVSDTLRNYAAQQTPPATLGGDYTITAVCRTALNPTSLGDFPGTIRFTSPTTYITPVVLTPTTTTLTVSASSVLPGVPVTFTAAVAPVGGTGTPTGTVQFMNNGANLGSPVALSGGTAAMTTSTLAVGAHVITAIYSGDTAFATSTSAPQTVTVTTLPGTNTTLSVNPGGLVDRGTPVTLTASVAPATGTGTPTGTVQFKDGAANLGSPVALTGGTATLTVNGPGAELSPGTHALTAVYSGDASFAGSSSPAMGLVVRGGAATASETITVTVPAGALTLTVDNTSVTLPDMQLNAANTLFTTSGSLNPATVTDTRAGNPGWNVSGQVTDFSQSAGSGVINGYNLGWTPTVIDSAAGQTVTPGGVVQPAPGIAPGATPSDPAQGLKTSRTLATAASGASLGTAHVSAGLALNAPTSTPAGTYSATLTLTAI